MAAAMSYSCSIVRQCTLPIRTVKLSLPRVPMNGSHQIQQAEIKITPQLTYTKKETRRKSLNLCVVPPNSDIYNTSSHTPAQTILQFYSAINEKNLKQLDRLIAEDCFFEDYSFPKPFQGKKEVLRFLRQLTKSMGDSKNMVFNIEHICEGDDYTAAANWHLDWKKTQVPFTRGCSIFSLSEDGDKLIIEEAKVLIESPFKLGVAALTIFKIVSSLFDAYPEATEWFLKSPHIIFQSLLRTYEICIKPIVTPLLAWYIKLLNFAACILSLTLTILYYLATIFHRN